LLSAINHVGGCGFFGSLIVDLLHDSRGSIMDFSDTTFPSHKILDVAVNFVEEFATFD
jgi:hypothetical protein